MYELRQYQREALDRLREALRVQRRVVLQLPTGAGKTVIAAEIAKRAQEKGNRVLFLAPRRELVKQTSGALKKMGILPGIIMSGIQPAAHRDVQVASWDTVNARGVRAGLGVPEADLIIVDEAHLSVTKSRMAIMDHYKDCKIIGLTATPSCAGGRGMRLCWDSMVLGPSVSQLVGEGALCRGDYYGGTEVDLSRLRISNTGEYRDDDVEKAVNRPEIVGDVVENWARLASDRRTVVFCNSIHHSISLQEEFSRFGVKCEHIDAKTPEADRSAIMDRVRSGETKVLCNVFIASYGIDIPELSCAVLARPMRSITLIMQTVGRVMRPAEGKEGAIVLDHGSVFQSIGMFPDEKIPWTLDGNDVLAKRIVAQKSKEEARLVECWECHNMFKACPVCPHCGSVRRKEYRGVKVYDFDLKLLKGDAKVKGSKLSEAEWYRALIAIRHRRGYRHGWEDHAFKSKFGRKPSRDLRNSKPVDWNSVPAEVTKFITHMAIRRAKGRSKQYSGESQPVSRRTFLTGRL